GGFGEVLPSADAYILDEAHQLPEVAAQFFGLSMSSRQLADLVRDTKFAYFEEAGDLPEVLETADALVKAALELRLALGVGHRRAAGGAVAEEPAGDATVARRLSCLEAVAVQRESLAVRGKNLEQCGKRAQARHDTATRLLS